MTDDDVTVSRISFADTESSASGEMDEEIQILPMESVSRTGSPGPAGSNSRQSAKWSIFSNNLSIIFAISLSMLGSSLYAYGRPTARVGGPIPAFIVIALAVTCGALSAHLISGATDHYKYPFDIAIGVALAPAGRVLSTVVQYIMRYAAVLLLVGVLAAIHVYLTGLWERVVFVHFVSDETARFYASFAVAFAITLLLQFIPNFDIIRRITSFFILSAVAAVAALIQVAVQALRDADTRTCAVQMLQKPFAWSDVGATLAQVAALFATCAGALFCHNGVSSFFQNHKGRPSTRPGIVAVSMVIDGLVFLITGSASALSSACHPDDVPSDSSSLPVGWFGIVAQVLFLIQCTCLAPLYLFIIRQDSVNRVDWERLRKKHQSTATPHNERESFNLTVSPTPSEVGSPVETVKGAPMYVWLPLNIVILGLAVLLVLLRVQLGDILKYAGGITSFVYVYTAPGVYWLATWIHEKKVNPGLAIECVLIFLAGCAQLVGIFCT